MSYATAGVDLCIRTEPISGLAKGRMTPNMLPAVFFALLGLTTP